MRGAFIGIESLNRSTLKRANKKINQVERYGEKLDVFRRHGVAVSANMIFGFDEDTKDSFEAVYRFIVGNSIYANPYILTPYPGTRLFQRIEESGRLRHKDWRRYTAYQQVVKSENLDREEIENLFWKTYERFYAPMLNFKRMFRRTLRSFFSPEDWYLNLRIYFYNSTFVSRPFIKRRLPPYF